MKASYSDRVKTDFLEAFAKRLQLIEQMPFMYPVYEQKPSVRRCIIPKYTACFYRVTDELILILAVSDTRADPDSVRL